MPHWYEKHSLRALRNKLTKTQKALDDVIALVDERLKRRSSVRRFNRGEEGAMKEIISAVKERPSHYTSRKLVSKFKSFGKESVLAAIDDLQTRGLLTFERGKKGKYVARPLK
jgi:hypothetical protein